MKYKDGCPFSWSFLDLTRSLRAWASVRDKSGNMIVLCIWALSALGYSCKVVQTEDRASPELLPSIR